VTATRARKSETTSVLVELPVDDLTLGDDYRLDDDPDAVAELATSISEYGVLQPLLVRAAPGRMAVVAGRRRDAAVRAAGLDRVPCILRDLTDDQARAADLLFDEGAS
jgi:ParB family chromosome partitioning protein